MAEFKVNKQGMAKLERETQAKINAFLAANHGNSPAEIRSAQKRIGLNLNDDAIGKLSRGEM